MRRVSQVRRLRTRVAQCEAIGACSSSAVENSPLQLIDPATRGSQLTGLSQQYAADEVGLTQDRKFAKF